MARTTIPFGGRAGAAATTAGTRGACGTASASGSAVSGAPCFWCGLFRPWQVGHYALHSGRSESLCDRLLATAATAPSSATPSPTSSALTFTTRRRRAGLPRGTPRFLAHGLRLKFRRGSFGNFGALASRLVLRLNVTRSRGARRLLSIKIRRLQRRRRRLTSSFRSLLFTALQSILHPFTHVQACNILDAT